MLKGWLRRHTKKGARQQPPGLHRHMWPGRRGEEIQQKRTRQQTPTRSPDNETRGRNSDGGSSSINNYHPGSASQQKIRDQIRCIKKIHQEKGKGDAWANVWPMLSGSPSDMKRSPSNAHVLPPSYSTCFHQQQVDMIFHLRAMLAKENAVRKQH